MYFSTTSSLSSTLRYDPFGMILFGRSWEGGSDAQYRFGFNGYENTDEILGENTAIDFGARIYDSRLGRFLSIDPRSVEYPWQSVYAYYSNCPIAIVDIDGMGGPGISDGVNNTAHSTAFSVSLPEVIVYPWPSQEDFRGEFLKLNSAYSKFNISENTFVNIPNLETFNLSSLNNYSKQPRDFNAMAIKADITLTAVTGIAGEVSFVKVPDNLGTWDDCTTLRSYSLEWIPVSTSIEASIAFGAGWMHFNNFDGYSVSGFLNSTSYENSYSVDVPVLGPLSLGYERVIGDIGMNIGYSANYFNASLGVGFSPKYGDMLKVGSFMDNLDIPSIGASMPIFQSDYKPEDGIDSFRRATINSQKFNGTEIGDYYKDWLNNH